jgi:hypothetical protein
MCPSWYTGAYRFSAAWLTAIVEPNAPNLVRGWSYVNSRKLGSGLRQGKRQDCQGNGYRYAEDCRDQGICPDRHAGDSAPRSSHPYEGKGDRSAGYYAEHHPACAQKYTALTSPLPYGEHEPRDSGNDGDVAEPQPMKGSPNCGTSLWILASACTVVANHRPATLG